VLAATDVVIGSTRVNPLSKAVEAGQVKVASAPPGSV
jgi:hypothetical protein